MEIAYAALNVALVVSVAFRAVRCVQIFGTGVGVMVVVTSAQAHNELWPWLVLGVSIACISLTYRPNWGTLNDNSAAPRDDPGRPGDTDTALLPGVSWIEDDSEADGDDRVDTYRRRVRKGSGGRHGMP